MKTLYLLFIVLFISGKVSNAQDYKSVDSTKNNNASSQVFGLHTGFWIDPESNETVAPYLGFIIEPKINVNFSLPIEGSINSYRDEWIGRIHVAARYSHIVSPKIKVFGEVGAGLLFIISPLHYSVGFGIKYLNFFLRTNFLFWYEKNRIGSDFKNESTIINIGIMF